MLVEHGARIEDNDIDGVRPVDLHHVRQFYFSSFNLNIHKDCNLLKVLI